MHSRTSPGRDSYQPSIVSEMRELTDTDLFLTRLKINLSRTKDATRILETEDSRSGSCFFSSLHVVPEKEKG